MKSNIANLDIRLIIQDCEIDYEEIAIAMNITETELKQMLQKELTVSEKEDLLDVMEYVVSI